MSLFKTFAGFWTPVLPAEQLKEKPLSTVLAGEKIVLFRGEKGVGALLDVCPHRGVSLALGKVVKGCLECPFHGWRFSEDGNCQHVPFNPEVDRSRLRTTALPVRERAGLIWVFTGLEAVGEPYIPEAFERPNVGTAYIYEDWKCHWTRAMENMLDTPHLPFVHAGTIGRGMLKALKDDSTLQQNLPETEVGFDIVTSMDQRPNGMLQWTRPNGMILHILDQPNRLMRLHVWCIPMEENQTRLLVGSVLNFGVFTPLAMMFKGVNRRIVFEDRDVVESSYPSCVPRPNQEKNVPTDRPTLKFRTWYFRHIVDGLPEEAVSAF